jgi:DinB family protein
MKAVACLIVLTGIGLTSTAREPTLSAAAAEMYTTISGDVVAAAKLMPAASYDYRPTPDVRSFGQVVGHLAGSQFLYCMQAGGPRFDRALVARLEPVRTYADPVTPAGRAAPSKESLVSLLEDGVRYCEAVHAAMTDAAAVAPITLGARQTIRIRPLLDNVAHASEHYGNLVTYLRERGLVPPSTARTGRGGTRLP